MKQGLSTHLFVEEKLSLERLKEVCAFGFETLEIFALKPHFDYQDKKFAADLAIWLFVLGWIPLLALAIALAATRLRATRAPTA